MNNTIIELPGLQAQQHLSSLHQLLCSASFLSEKEEIQDHGLLQEIRNLLDIIQRHPLVHPSIKIEGSISGFPHFQLVNSVLLDKKYATEFLSKLPSIESCIENCFSSLHLPKANFTSLQKTVQRINYFKELQESTLPVLSSCHLASNTSYEDFSSYTVAYKGHDVTKMRFFCYSFLIYQQGNSSLIRENQLTAEAEKLLSDDTGLSALDLFRKLNHDKKAAVISAERIVVGPFYTGYTDNRDARITALLSSPSESDKDTNGILEIEQQVCEDDEVYLTQDLKKALNRKRKTAFLPPLKYRRHFFCQSPSQFEYLQRAMKSEEYATYVYLKKEGVQQEVNERVSETDFEDKEGLQKEVPEKIIIDGNLKQGLQVISDVNQQGEMTGNTPYRRDGS